VAAAPAAKVSGRASGQGPSGSAGGRRAVGEAAVAGPSWRSIWGWPGSASRLRMRSRAAASSSGCAGRRRPTGWRRAAAPGAGPARRAASPRGGQPGAGYKQLSRCVRHRQGQSGCTVRHRNHGPRIKPNLRKPKARTPALSCQNATGNQFVPAQETGLPASYHYRGLRTFGPFSDRPQSPLAGQGSQPIGPRPGSGAASRGGPGLPLSLQGAELRERRATRRTASRAIAVRLRP
jgi:hypothetical protein